MILTPKLKASRSSQLALMIGAFLILAGGVMYASFVFAAADSGDAVLIRADGRQSLTVKLPAPNLLRPMSPEEAVQANAQRALSSRVDMPAVAFKLKTDQGSSERAIECLAQAVYYEAAMESAEGQRAVAQVVLNRVRHPAYPASICGVVYQGSERATGCQFTFTCDGSLARIPAAWRWKQAQETAIEALSGRVFAPVGHATHYHANYVLPYWADSLDKAAQIGRHIFYRLKGSMGSSRAFSQPHKGSEPLPPPTGAVVLPLEVPSQSTLVTDPINVAGGLEAIAGELVANSAPIQAPVADATAGGLLKDEGVIGRRNNNRAEPSAKSACKADESTRLEPMGTANMQPQGSTSC